MKILVPCKPVSDPDNASKIKVVDGGAAISEEGLEQVPNPFDDWAVEAALRLTENASTKERVGEVVVVTIGEASATQVIRKFLAMGADRGVLIEATDKAVDAPTVARALKAIVEKEKPDMVVMGKRASDGENNAVGQMLAEYLGWPQGTDAMHVATNDDGKTVEVHREVDGGLIKLKVQGPLVITASDRIVAPGAVKNGVTPDDFKYPESDSGRFPSMKGIMQSKKKPLEQLKLAELGVEQPLSTSYSDFALPPARSGQATFVESADELIQKLSTEAKAL